MTFEEVRRMCEDIDYYAGHKLSRDDEYEFKKLWNRVKDDEDLDQASLRKLQDIFQKYVKSA